MPAGTVEVFLIGATGIKDTEVFGKADPYALLFCGKQKLRSNTASNQGSKPVWNQKFSFYIDDNTTELQIKVYNHNILTEDDEIGSTIIPLAKVFADNKLPTTSYNVVRPSGRVQGEVKLSISFTAKRKPGQQVPQDIPGPYTSKKQGSPYAAIPPEPKVKHDPLVGPYGYFKNNSSASSVTGSSHGKKPNSLVIATDSGSSKPYPSSSVHGYTPAVYPPVAPVNDPQAYQRTDSNPSYHSTNSFSPSGHESSHGRYPAAPPPDYSGSVYDSPYGHGPPHLSAANPHGIVPMSPASPAYPPLSGPNSSYPSDPNLKHSHSGGGNHYSQYNDLAGRFGSLNVSGSDSHVPYPGYNSTPSFSHAKPPSGYPPMQSDSNYHGYNPATGTRPGSEYPPTGYPTQYDSGHGSFSRPGSYSLQGYQAPQSSFYPPETGIHQSPYSRAEGGDAPNPYPPSPYYSAPPPAHYVPAGYPK